MTEQHPFEAQIRALLDAGQRDEAAGLIAQRYSQRVADFLYGKVKDLALTEDLLQEVHVRMLTHLDQWRGGALQAWLLAIARSTWSRHFRDPANRASRQASLSDHPALAQALARARTQTMHHLRTSVRVGVRELWAGFTADEQRLLRLRLDERLSWSAIVARLADEPLDPATVRQRAQTLRKRFERLKTRLAERAQAAGIGPARDPDGSG